ncbi:hypothetical protein PPYR_14569 [Photinus pyralis]|uniref:Methylosome subunit pICln n=2 Tax=Photinus pyralis TaxID=7054 RepID=A0A5N4A5L0_PHOPY|nr:methylosome subunit pICln [Photinus pyralis]KAB0792610.1 hypothetical protein PPYR_14569 [Photinus pyralis]
MQSILSAFALPESPILCQTGNTKAIIDGVDLGNGTVFVNERKLSWKNDDNTGFAVDFPHISLHAITADPNVHPTKCLFIMVDDRLSIQGYEFLQQPMENGATEESDDESESETPSRLVLVPRDLDAINPLFSALSLGQSLNPDPHDSMEEEEDEDDNIYGDAEDTSDGVNHLSAGVQNVTINYNYSNGDQDVDEDQFEDAD